MSTISKSIIIFLICLFPLASCSVKKEVYEPKSLDELTGHKLGLMEGSVQASYAEANLKDKGVELVYFPSIPDGLMAVRQGAADVFFGNPLATFNEAFKSQHMKICLNVEEIEALTGYGLKKGNDGLRNELDSFIDKLKNSGELDEILSRWLSPDNTDFHDTYRLDPIPSIPSGKGKILKIGISENNPPATIMVDNKWTGYEIEILQRFAEEYGYQLKVTSYTFNNLIPAVNSGLEDIIASTLILTEERKQKIDFSHVTVNLHTALIVADPGYKPSGTLWQRIKASAYSSLVKENRWRLIVQGFKATLVIALSSFFFGCIFGGLVCSLRMSRKKWKRALAKAYIYFMRNTPILVFIMILFYVVFAGSGLSPICVAIIAFSLNSAAFIAEIYRAGIQSVDRGQTEAAVALGFTNLRAFFNIVVPQAAKQSLPVFTNECITLLKGTSIVGYISIIDLTKASDLIRSSSFEAFFPLLLITVVYFILASIITFALEKAVNRM